MGFFSLEVLDEAERVEPRVIQWLQRGIADSLAAGQTPRLIFNPSSPVHVQGPFFVEPSDPDHVKDAKRRRMSSSAILDWLKKLTPGLFESLSANVLRLIGARHFRQTRRSKDQGIDFYGRLVLEDLEREKFPFLKFQHNMEMWLLGQAKHYPEGTVSAPEVRELVGAVVLARARAFATHEALFPDLRPRVADPLVALFLTTGTFTRDAQMLAQSSGVVLKAGEDIANLLSDEGIGFVGTDDTFDESAATEWLREHE